jgi:hypothetical protein
MADDTAADPERGTATGLTGFFVTSFVASADGEANAFAGFGAGVPGFGGTAAGAGEGVDGEGGAGFGAGSGGRGCFAL